MSTNPAHLAAQAAVAASTSVAPAMQALQDQLAMALQKIQEQAAMLDALKPPKLPNSCIYHSVSQHIKVPIMRAPGHCEFVQFVRGQLETKDPAVIAVIEAAIRAGGSGFSHGPAEEPPEVAEMQADMAQMAASSHAKMIAAGEKTA